MLRSVPRVRLLLPVAFTSLTLTAMRRIVCAGVVYELYGVPPVAHRYMDAIRMFGTHFATEVHFGAMTVVQARRTDSNLWPNQISAALPSQSAAVRPSAVRPSAVRPSAVRPSCLIGGRCHVPQLG